MRSRPWKTSCGDVLFGAGDAIVLVVRDTDMRTL